MPIIKEEPLSKYDPASFAFNHVKAEVSEAMRQDWKHDKVDDAKKRAIHAAKNYDDFKQRVAGCTLKPISPGEFNAPPRFAFNRQVAPGGPRTQAANASGALGALGTTPGSRAATVVRSARELERELRRRSPAESVELLAQLGETDCARLFSRELDAELLRQMLLVLDEAGVAAPGCARRLLLALAAHCPASAAAAAAFLGQPERLTVARLLAREPGDLDDDARVCAALGVQSCLLSEARARAGMGASALSEPPSEVASCANAHPAPGARPCLVSQAVPQADTGTAAVSEASSAAAPCADDQAVPDARPCLVSPAVPQADVRTGAVSVARSAAAPCADDQAVWGVQPASQAMTPDGMGACAVSEAPSAIGLCGLD